MATATTTRTDSLDRYRRAFSRLDVASEPEWLARARTAGLEKFMDRGFPKMTEEAWRFTNVASLVAADLALPPKGGRTAVDDSLLSSLRLGDWDRHELVFVDGRFDRARSSLPDGELPRGLVILSLAEAIREHPGQVEAALTSGVAGAERTVFFELNRAFLDDGAFLRVEPGTVVERPVHLVFLSSSPGTMSHPRNVVLVGAGSELRVVESYGGSGVYYTNAVTQIVLEDNAILEHYKLQRESEAAFHTASIDCVQGRGATFRDHSISLGARLARHDIRVLLDGDGSDLTLNGLYAVSGSQHVDHHTVIDHKAPSCTSRELYKGILDEASSGVFDGLIVVRPQAQKTNAQQSNKNLLLSRKALVNTNPQLEINADDVKCAHGATIGQLDEDALFYLRSRGIPVVEARKILTRGFIADISERIRIEALRQSVSSLVLAEVA